MKKGIKRRNFLINSKATNIKLFQHWNLDSSFCSFNSFMKMQIGFKGIFGFWWKCKNKEIIACSSPLRFKWITESLSNTIYRQFLLQYQSGSFTKHRYAELCFQTPWTEFHCPIYLWLVELHNDLHGLFQDWYLRVSAFLGVCEVRWKQRKYSGKCFYLRFRCSSQLSEE